MSKYMFAGRQEVGPSVSPQLLPIINPSMCVHVYVRACVVANVILLTAPRGK